MPELGVGSKCFWKGNIYKISGSSGKDNWLLYRDGGTAFVVGKKYVEPVAQEVFPLHCKVFGIRYFYGQVTAHEQDTNRVICRTLRDEDYEGVRARYAYKVHELKRDPASELILDLESI